MQTEKQKTGNKGEELATELLVSKGFKIKHRNWRFKHKEIDIVAMHNDELVIIEVKARTEDTYEEPWQAVTNQKIRFLADATEAYIEQYDIENEVRFDVISIVFKSGVPEIEHFENAFRPWA